MASRKNTFDILKLDKFAVESLPFFDNKFRLKFFGYIGDLQFNILCTGSLLKFKLSTTSVLPTIWARASKYRH